jgi:Ca-activated chloride channel family protein
VIALAHPAALALVLLLPMALWLRRRAEGRAAAALPGAGEVRGAGPSFTLRLGGWLRPLGLVAAVLALAGPNLPPDAPTYAGRGVDMMFAVDLSPSMAAMDMPAEGRTITRLAAVAEAAKTLALSRPGDRIGLVAFGARAYLVVPPTTDRAALVQALSSLDTGAAGRKTAMGDAVGLAAKRLDESPGQAKAVIVFGDGRSNAGEADPVAAAQAAARHGVTVFAVGVGGDGPAPFLVAHPILGKQIITEAAPVDEAALTSMAQAGGGAFWRAGDPAALARATAAIDTMTPSDIRAEQDRGQSLTPLLAGLAVCLLTAWAALAATRGLTLP